MYITSELFGSDPRYPRCGLPQTVQPWNTMADSQQQPGLGKRKRRSEADEGPSSKFEQQPTSRFDGESHTAFPSASSSQQRSPSSRGLLKLQGVNPASLGFNNRLAANSTKAFASDRRPLKQLKRSTPKAALVTRASQLMDLDFEPSPPTTASHETHSNSDLRPCHICSSAPKRKRDLENYLECHRCKGRTCYICARECSTGCLRAICRNCAVEVGREGDQWCLDCYTRSPSTQSDT